MTMHADPATSSDAPARCPGLSVQDWLDRDSRPVPEQLRWESHEDLGSDPIDPRRYLSREFHDLEVERMWRKVWQLACLESEIPNVGNHVVYDVGPDSLIVVRSGPDRIQAFHNACLHRGTTLRDRDGTVPEFRCPYHAFTWNLDGSMKDLPCEWDFGHIDKENFGLPEAQVATWDGLVFINMDPDAAPLMEYLEGLPEHVRPWPLEKRFKAVHVTKIMPCNWKLSQEAFLESWHVAGTHPMQTAFVADASSEYSTYPGKKHFNRQITLQGIASPVLGDDWTEQSIMDALQETYAGVAVDTVMGGDPIEVPEGTTARSMLADIYRDMLSQQTGVDLSAISDCEALDAIEYSLFPNLNLWYGYSIPMVYRFRPNGDDHETSIIDLIWLYPFPEGAEPPAPAQRELLALDELWVEAAGMAGVGSVFDQDTDNLIRQMKGLKVLESLGEGVTLSNYQDKRIRHFHNTLDEYLAVGE